MMPLDLTQKKAIIEAYQGSEWWTLEFLVLFLRIEFKIWASEAGVSARLRELRSEGWIVDKRIRKGANNLYEYSLRRR